MERRNYKLNERETCSYLRTLILGGPFYIDTAKVPVQLYQEALTENIWSPTKVVFDICHQRGWSLPEYRVVNYCAASGYLYEMTVNNQEFVSQYPDTTQDTAKEMAAARFLQYLGFRINLQELNRLPVWLLSHDARLRLARLQANLEMRIANFKMFSLLRSDEQYGRQVTGEIFHARVKSPPKMYSVCETIKHDVASFDFNRTYGMRRRNTRVCKRFQFRRFMTKSYIEPLKHHRQFYIDNSTFADVNYKKSNRCKRASERVQCKRPKRPITRSSLPPLATSGSYTNSKGKYNLQDRVERLGEATDNTISPALTSSGSLTKLSGKDNLQDRVESDNKTPDNGVSPTLLSSVSFTKPAVKETVEDCVEILDEVSNNGISTPLTSAGSFTKLAVNETVEYCVEGIEDVTDNEISPPLTSAVSFTKLAVKETVQDRLESLDEVSNNGISTPLTSAVSFTKIAVKETVQDRLESVSDASNAGTRKEVAFKISRATRGGGSVVKRRKSNRLLKQSNNPPVTSTGGVSQQTRHEAVHDYVGSLDESSDAGIRTESVCKRKRGVSEHDKLQSSNPPAASEESITTPAGDGTLQDRAESFGKVSGAGIRTGSVCKRKRGVSEHGKLESNNPPAASKESVTTPAGEGTEQDRAESFDDDRTRISRTRRWSMFNIVKGFLT